MEKTQITLTKKQQQKHFNRMIDKTVKKALKEYSEEEMKVKALADSMLTKKEKKKRDLDTPMTPREYNQMMIKRDIIKVIILVLLILTGVISYDRAAEIGIGLI